MKIKIADSGETTGGISYVPSAHATHSVRRVLPICCGTIILCIIFRTVLWRYGPK
jgi:hypothetical protein